jgi:hypothetical protein
LASAVSDGDAHARRLPRDAACEHHFGGNDKPTRNEAPPALVFAGEDENHNAFGDMLAAVHGLLRGEDECPRLRIIDLGLDRERHVLLTVLNRLALWLRKVWDE